MPPGSTNDQAQQGPVGGPPDFGFLEVHRSEQLSLIQHPIAPGVLAAPMHLHTVEDELSYVLSGQIQALVGGRLLTAGPGEVVWKPRRVPHTFWNPGPEPSLVLECIVPGGFADYFREMAELIAGGQGPPGQMRVKEIQQRYGLEVDDSSAARLLREYGLRLPRI